jgi:hypothetical protein
LGDVKFGADGGWTEAEAVAQRSRDQTGGSVQGGKAETLLELAALRSGRQIERYPDVAQ